MPAEKTSPLFLAPPVDARHIRAQAEGKKKKGKKKVNQLSLELGTTATGRCHSPP